MRLRRVSEWASDFFLAKTDVSDSISQILNNPTQTASLHEKAADCICMILQALDEDCKARVDIAGEEPFSNRTQMKHMHVYSYITAFEQPYHLAVAHEDLEK